MSGRVAPSVVTNGLVLCLDAANTKSYVSGSTTWNDLTGGGFNGVLTNGPILASSSIQFDGTNDYVVNTTYSTTTTIQDRSIEVVFKTNGASLNSALMGIFSLMGGSTRTGNAQLELITDSTGTSLQGNLFGFSGATTVSSSVVLNTWYHATLTQNTNPKEVRLYLNSQFITSSVYTSNLYEFPCGGIHIGVQKIATTRYLRGNVAIAKLYNKTLSAQEILQNYNATKKRFGL